MSQTATSWIEESRISASASFRLFCFPYAGGNSLTFFRWDMFLPANVDVCPIQLPGHGRRIREEPFTDLRALADALASALPPRFDVPFAFFGHSMGALIGYELACRLREKSQTEPVGLFMSGCQAPHLPRSPATYHLPDGQFINDLRRLKGTPEEILSSREAMDLLLPTLRADFAMTQTYEHRERSPLRSPIACFGGVEDADICEEHLAQWRRYTTGEFHLHLLSGDHFFINSQQSALLGLIRKHLVTFLQHS